MRFDKKYDKYEREVFGFGDFIENVGGFYSAILILGMVIVPFFSERLYFSSLIRKVYQIENPNKDQEND